MAREPTGSRNNDRETDERVPDAKGHIRIMIGDEVVQAYDAENLDDTQRKDIASRIVRYADSQTLGLRKVR